MRKNCNSKKKEEAVTIVFDLSKHDTKYNEDAEKSCRFKGKGYYLFSNCFKWIHATENSKNNIITVAGVRLLTRGC